MTPEQLTEDQRLANNEFKELELQRKGLMDQVEFLKGMNEKINNIDRNQTYVSYMATVGDLIPAQYVPVIGKKLQNLTQTVLDANELGLLALKYYYNTVVDELIADVNDYNVKVESYRQNVLLPLQDSYDKTAYVYKENTNAWGDHQILIYPSQEYVPIFSYFYVANVGSKTYYFGGTAKTIPPIQVTTVSNINKIVDSKLPEKQDLLSWEMASRVGIREIIRGGTRAIKPGSSGSPVLSPGW